MSKSLKVYRKKVYEAIKEYCVIFNQENDNNWIESDKVIEFLEEELD